MYRDKINIKVKCPTHPRFDPHHGAGAIKGGCPHCWLLVKWFKAVHVLKGEMASIQGEIDLLVGLPSKVKDWKVTRR